MTVEEIDAQISEIYKTQSMLAEALKELERKREELKQLEHLNIVALYADGEIVEVITT